VYKKKSCWAEDPSDFRSTGEAKRVWYNRIQLNMCPPYEESRHDSRGPRMGFKTPGAGKTRKQNVHPRGKTRKGPRSKTGEEMVSAARAGERECGGENPQAQGFGKSDRRQQNGGKTGNCTGKQPAGDTMRKSGFERGRGQASTAPNEIQGVDPRIVWSFGFLLKRRPLSMDVRNKPSRLKNQQRGEYVSERANFRHLGRVGVGDMAAVRTLSPTRRETTFRKGVTLGTECG